MSLAKLKMIYSPLHLLRMVQTNSIESLDPQHISSTGIQPANTIKQVKQKNNIPKTMINKLSPTLTNMNKY